MTPNDTKKIIAAAEMLGWRNEIRRSYRETPAWFHPNGISMYDNPPNFLTDANASMLLIEWMTKKGFRFKSNCGTGFTFEAQFWRKIYEGEIVNEDYVAIIDGERCIEPYGCADTFPIAVLNAFLTAHGKGELV